MQKLFQRPINDDAFQPAPTVLPKTEVRCILTSEKGAPLLVSPGKQSSRRTHKHSILSNKSFDVTHTCALCNILQRIREQGSPNFSTCNKGYEARSGYHFGEIKFKQQKTLCFLCPFCQIKFCFVPHKFSKIFLSYKCTSDIFLLIFIQLSDIFQLQVRM